MTFFEAVQTGAGLVAGGFLALVVGRSLIRLSERSRAAWLSRTERHVREEVDAERARRAQRHDWAPERSRAPNPAPGVKDA